MKTIGERHWTHGPIILGSKKLHTAICRGFEKEDARKLTRLKKELSVVELRGETVLAMAKNEETGVVPWGEAVVLVHAYEDSKDYLLERDRVKAIASIDPRTIPAEQWKAAGTIELDKDPVLFDIHARHLEAEEKSRALTVTLPKGEYVVELASGTAEAKPYPSKIVTMTYTFVRLRPPSWSQPAAKAAKTVVDEGPVAASADVIAKAKKLACASSDGIPMVLAPRKYLSDWKGMEDDSRDYDRACDVDGLGVIQIGKGKGLVISEPGGMMFWPTTQGGLIVVWLGADSQAGCIAAALSVPDKAWKKQRAKLVVEKGAEELVLFESAAAGSSLKKNGTIGDEGEKVAIFKLASGSYAIDAVWGWEARVKVGKKIEDTSVNVIRLTRG